MTADLDTNEFLTFTNTSEALALSPRRGRATVLHEYGRLAIAEGGRADDLVAESATPEIGEDLTLVERLGRDAFQLRSAPAARASKLERAYSGRAWGEAESGGPLPIHIAGDDVVTENSREARAGTDEAEAEAAAPLSARFTGRVAVGIVIVKGTAAHLNFSQAEQTNVVAEVQNGLSFIGTQAPNHDVTFVYDIKVISVSVPEVTQGTTYEAFEAPWRNAAFLQMGLAPGLASVTNYASNLRNSLGTQWAYVAFFTKYRLKHFAYASVGGPRLVMHYGNDGWGSNQIDRVFAHESGHIFGAPDEYANSNCNCGGSWGVFGKPNANCGACAPSGGVSCIMKSNDWAMCNATKYHFGYTGLP